MAGWVLPLGLFCIFLGIAIAVAMTGAIGRERSEIASSLASIEAIGGPLPHQLSAALDRPLSRRVGDPVLGWFVKVGRVLTGTSWAAITTTRLDMAGNPVGWSVERVLAWKSILAVALGALVAMVLALTQSAAPALIWGIAAAVLGFFLPDLRLRDVAKKRSEAVRRALPDSLDLMTVSVESGLPFDAALAQVAQNTDGPLSDELRRVLKEIQIGRGRSEALHALAGRTDVDELKVWVSSMTQAEKLGMPIADVLRVQAGEMRTKRSQRIEEAANKLPIKMVFPIMFCIMPSVFIVLLGPAILQIEDVFSGP